MNNKCVINEIKNNLNITQEEAVKINSIFNNHFIIGKNNKQKIIDDLMSTLNMDSDTADNTYNVVMSIISNALKDKIKHPFRKKD